MPIHDVEKRIMARFQKTRIHAATAVLFLLTLYALAGLCYAMWSHSPEAVTVWAIIAAGAFVAGLAYQRYVSGKRKREPS
jgi:fatty acid desaturase